MPRKPVEKVIEHRISLSGKERELLESAVFGYGFNNVSSPIIALLSDISAMTFLTGVYLTLRYGDDVAAGLGDGFDNLGELFSKANALTKNAQIVGEGLQNIPFFGISINDLQNIAGRI